MKRTFAALTAVVVLAVTVAFSRQDAPPALRLDSENRNPWTHSKLNNGPDTFQFAVVSDRTGGHREKVFSRAVDRLNLMQPEFVVSVGDLIEGGKKKPDKIAEEWKEFDSYAKKLTMPFFYVPGNHDTGNVDNDKAWQERYGRKFYYFVYRNVLFLCLNTDDHVGGSGAPRLGAEQVAYAKKALADNPSVRWTLVFLHKPIWTATELKKRGWLDVEEVLANRPYTVFCGHVHKYRKFVRQGRNYYQLATTGGGSKMRGVSYGEFDQIVWVTMKPDGPVLANVVLDSVLTDELKVPDSAEAGTKYPNVKLHPVRGVVYLDGVPVVGAQVALSVEEKDGRRRVRSDGLTEGDGSFVLSTLKAFDGAPAGKYVATVTLRRPVVTPEGKAGPNLLPAKYAEATTSPLTVEIKEGENVLKLDLSR
jgi:serine/threonine-protein phosphatase CPPED1